MVLKLDTYMSSVAHKRIDLLFTEKRYSHNLKLPNLMEVLDKTESSPYVSNDFQKLVKYYNTFHICSM
jgi:hypothetical protein